MRKTLCAGLLLSLSLSGYCQSYAFHYQNSSDKFDLRTTDDRLYCLHKTSGKKVEPTVFQNVILNGSLLGIDSAEYKIEGRAALLASGQNEKYIYHAFYSKSKTAQKLNFVLLNYQGQVQFTFSKTTADFNLYFNKPISTFKYIQLDFISNIGTPDMLLINVCQANAHKKIVALDSETGKFLWAFDLPSSTENIETTPDKVLILSHHASGGPSDYTIHFYDKNNGQLLKVLPFRATVGWRQISVFATNGQELLIAGTKFITTKEGHLFTSIFDSSGEKILDEVDSATRFSSKRWHIIGNVFDSEGNLVLIGEGWKIDATRAIAGTAASIALTALVGTPTRIYTQVDHKVETLNFAQISTGNGRVKNSWIFPVAPSYQFGNLITDGAHVLISYGSEILVYDPDSPDSAPRHFTSLQNRESLFLTPIGPLMVECETTKKHFVLRFL